MLRNDNGAINTWAYNRLDLDVKESLGTETWSSSSFIQVSKRILWFATLLNLLENPDNFSFLDPSGSGYLLVMLIYRGEPLNLFKIRSPEAFFSVNKPVLTPNLSVAFMSTA